MMTAKIMNLKTNMEDLKRKYILKTINLKWLILDK